MSFGGLNIRVGSLNKKSILNGIVGVASALLEEKSPEQDMAKTMSRRVMADPQVQFLLRSLTSRFNLWGADVRVVPHVAESSLVIDKWALTVDEKPAIEADGYEELSRQITEYVLTTEEDKIKDFVSKLEACVR